MLNIIVYTNKIMDRIPYIRRWQTLSILYVIVYG